MRIPYLKINWSWEDIRGVRKVIQSGKDWAFGDIMFKLEKALAKYVGTKYALVFNSGTSALHASLIALGIKPGDEVIVPSFTFVATVNVVKMVGATPVFADIESQTFGLDPNDVIRKITKKTKAIIPVHYGGNPCKIMELGQMAIDNKLFLIEDACESLGANIGGKMVGSFGDIAVFSFCQNKLITAGEGGAITTNSQSLYEKLKLIRSHGRIDDDTVCLGYNYRMPAICSALIYSQLKRIKKIIKRRRQIAKKFSENLSIVPAIPDNYFGVNQMITIWCNENRNKLIKRLNDAGIETRIFFNPVHKKTYYNDDVWLPITDVISKNVLSLPIYPGLKKEEINYIINQILWNKKKR